MKPDSLPDRSSVRRALLIIGLVLTIAGSTAIEVGFLLLLTFVPVEALRIVVLAGIAGVALGSAVLWLSRQRQT